MSSTDNGSSSEKDAILEKYNSLSVGELLKLIKLVRPRTSHNCSRETLVKMCCDNHVDILRQQTAQGSQQRVSRGKAKKASKEKAKKVNPVVDDKSSDSEEGNGTDDEDEPSLPAKKAKTVLNSSMDDEKFVTKVVNEIRNQIVDIIPKKSLFSDFTFEDKRSANEYFHWKSIGTILEKNLDRQEVDLDELQDALEIAKKRAAVLIAAEEYSWSVASRLAASHRLQQIPLLNEYASQIEEAVKQARADQTGGGQNSRKRKRGFSYASTYRNSVSSPSVAQVNHNSFTNGIVDKDICKACGGKGHYAYVCPSVKNGTSKVGDSSGYRAKSNHQQANVNKDPSIYMDLYSSVVSATKQFLLAKNDEDVVARRLSKFYNYWAQEIGASQEVLSYIAGVDMQFDEQAAERIPFKGNKLNEDNQEEMEFVRQEILEMVKSGALVQVPWRPKTISALKIVPKAGKKRFRLVVNIRRKFFIRLLVYLDDFAMIARNEVEMRKSLLIVERELKRAGFIREPSKGCFSPTQSLPFLGLVVCSKSMQVFIPEDKLIKSLDRINAVINMDQITVRSLAKLVGLLIFLMEACSYVRVFLRNAIGLISDLTHLKPVTSWNRVTPIPLQVKEDLKMVQLNLRNWNGKRIKKYPVMLIVETDASLQGWGGHIVGTSHRINGFWTESQASLHISILEMFAIIKTFRHFRSELHQKRVLVRTDNMNAMYAILKVRSKMPLLDLYVELFWKELIDNEIHLEVEYIRSELNRVADQLSRLSPVHEWTMSQLSFNESCKRLEVWPTIDRFASPSNSKLPRFNSVVDNCLTMTNWGQEINYVCCPFNLIPRVVDLMILQKAQGLIVVPLFVKAWFLKLLPFVRRWRRLRSQDFLPSPSGDCEPHKNIGWCLAILHVNMSSEVHWTTQDFDSLCIK